MISIVSEQWCHKRNDIIFPHSGFTTYLDLIMEYFDRTPSALVLAFRKFQFQYEAEYGSGEFL